MMELTELQKKEIRNAITEIDRIHRITAFDNLKKARIWSGFGMTAGVMGVVTLWSGFGINATSIGGVGSFSMPLLLLASGFLAWFTNQKLSIYSEEMRKAEQPLSNLGLKYQPPGSGVESDGYGRSVTNTKGYIVNKNTNTYLDIADLIRD